MSHARLGHEGLGTVVTRAVALAAIAGGLGLAQSLWNKPILLNLDEGIAAGRAKAASAAGGAVPEGDVVSAPAPVIEPSGTEAESKPTAPVVVTPEPVKPAPVEPAATPGKLSAEAAYEMFLQGAQFIDARREDEWLAGRVMGALRTTPGELESGDVGSLEVIDALIPGMPIVIYCIGGDCKDSENVAILLGGMGFGNIRIMEASYNDWAEAGYPTEAGAAGGQP